MYTPPNQYAPYPQQPVRRWWQHPGLIIAALVLLPPVGIALAWMSGWSQAKKITATVLASLWFLVILLSDSDKKEADDSKAQTVATATATASATPSDAAAPAPSVTPSAVPSADPVMPAVVGRPFNEAEKSVEDLVDGELTALSAYTDVTLPSAHAGWVVCFQNPAAGAALPAKSAAPTVHLVAPGTNCPATTDTRLTPEAKKSTPPPTQDDDTGSGSTSTGGSSSGSTGGGDSVYYKNCDAAKAAGAAPILRGQPGYRAGLDRDKDGIACDK